MRQPEFKKVTDKDTASMRVMKQLRGSESLKDIRNIVASNPILESITTAGLGRTKTRIIEDINSVIKRYSVKLSVLSSFHLHS